MGKRQQGYPDEFRREAVEYVRSSDKSTRQACWDNAVVESFFATLKTECDRSVWPTYQAARTDIYRLIEAFYNRRRRHSALAYLTPVEYDHQQLATLAAA